MKYVHWILLIGLANPLVIGMKVIDLVGALNAPSKITQESSDQEDYPFDKDRLIKWNQMLLAESRIAESGGKRSYPFSFLALEEYHAFIQALANLEGRMMRLTGFGMNVLEKNPEERKVKNKGIGILKSVVDVRFLRVRSKKFPRYAGDGFFTLEETVIPFYGSFYKPDGSEVTEEELTKIGLEWLKDENGNQIRFPAFVTFGLPSRVLILPIPKQRLKIVIENGRIRILATLEDYETFISEKFGEETIKELKQKADGVTHNHFAHRYETSSDYYQEIARRNHILMFQDFLIRNGFNNMINIIAIEYKGTGGQYVSQIVPLENAKRGQLKVTQRVLPETSEEVKKVTNAVLISDEQYEGKKGIILADYQSLGDAIGGCGLEELITFDLDRELLNHGAQLSTLNIGAIEIASQQDLLVLGASPNLNPLVVAIRVVLDDTRSLFEILHDYDEFLKTEVDSNIEKARESHLNEVSGQLAINIAACLKTGYTIDIQDISTSPVVGMTRNVSPWGLLRDTGDLKPIRIPQEATILIKSMFDTVFVVAKKAGLNRIEFVKSKQFDLMMRELTEAIGGSREMKESFLRSMEIIRRDTSNARNEEEAYQRLMKLIRLIFDYWSKVFNIAVTKEGGQLFERYISNRGDKDLNILIESQRISSQFNESLPSSEPKLIPALELLGESAVSKMGEAEVGRPTPQEGPEAGYKRLLSKADLAFIAQRMGRIGLDFLLRRNIACTRTQWSRSSSDWHLSMGIEKWNQRENGRELQTEILIPDYPNNQFQKMAQLIPYPDHLFTVIKGLVPNQAISISDLTDLTRRAGELKNRHYPPLNTTTLKKFMLAAVFHEIGETMWLVIESKAFLDNHSEAKRLHQWWRSNAMRANNGVIFIKNYLKDLMDPEDDFLANAFADKFVMFIDPNSIYKGIGEWLTQEEQMFFYEIARFFQQENDKDGTAFLVQQLISSSIETAL